MKAEHRHELKTNELAEWLANLPKWAEENMRMIIYLTVIAILVLGTWMWKTYQKNVVSVNEKLRFSQLLSEFYQNRRVTLEQQSQGIDLSYTLLQTANRLQDFAETAGKPDMAAMALIKFADAQRMELHYRMGSVDNQTVSSQIAKAKTAYEEAVEKASDNPSLRAIATFGLGLCEEELGNFDKAKEIYQQIVADPAFDATIAADSARHRLKIMDDYKQMVVFKAPEAMPVPVTEPDVFFPMIDVNSVEIIPAAVNSALEQ